MIPARFPTLFAALITLAATAACDASPDYLKQQGRRRRLAALGIERFDSAAAFRLAGMSTHRDIRIDALDPSTLGPDTLDPAYHVFHMRCGSCHEVPAPSSKPGYLWDAVMSRMKTNARDAGLMPIGPDDEAIVLRFLQEHAGDRP